MHFDLFSLTMALSGQFKVLVSSFFQVEHYKYYWTEYFSFRNISGRQFVIQLKSNQ